MITLTFLMLALVFGILRFTICASWSILKFIIGLGLFIAFPMLFIWILVSGMFGIGLIPALLLAWLFSALFKRA